MLTQEYLHQIFNYDPDIGHLTYKKNCGNRKAGTRAGSAPTSSKSRQICINYKTYLEHRIIWVYVYNYWPDQIDHINNDPHDNRLVNLRNCSKLENNFNRRTKPSKKNLPKWVEQRGNKYLASVRFNKKKYFLGRYDSPDEAHIVAKLFLREKHGEYFCEI